MDTNEHDVPEELGEKFRNLEMEVTHQFTMQKTVEIWGEGVTRADPHMTLKSAMPFIEDDKPDDTFVEMASGADAGSSLSVMLSMHKDGSASMTMPGASVTLSPRRTSANPGGEYEIGETLGVGGMGMVNVARQASLDRRIVVKSIRPEFAERVDAQEKFIVEALATGSLDHPNVVPIHDMGVGADGHLFYVMKEVKGKNWRQMLPKMSEPENIDTLFRVCDAIACAHDKGIIHRDLKPENIMLGDYGEVLVMDWGLAAAVSPNAKAAHLTNANACAGTPSFMAPEMARGLAHDLGPWSDQYLLGATLYNILTGHPPHPGKTAQEGVVNAANNIIAPTDRRDEWMNVAMRAMHTLPHKRFPSVKAFQRALRNCQVHHESISLSQRGDEYLTAGRTGAGHEAFTRAINSYEQAQVLWKDNPNIVKKIRDARFAYGESAFKAGDFGLVVSLLDKSPDDRERALVNKARMEIALTEKRRRRVKLFGTIAVLCLAVTIIGLSVAYYMISNTAAEEIKAREEADRQRRVANVRRQEAEDQRSIAEEQRAEAERQRRRAEDNAAEAMAARQLAEERLVAVRKAQGSEARAVELQLKEVEARLIAEEKARRNLEEALRYRLDLQRQGLLEDNTRWIFDADEAKLRQSNDALRNGMDPALSLSLRNRLMRMVVVPTGSFVMGSPPREPSRNNDEYLHEVTITHPFHMSATEVTRAQWRAVVGTESLVDIGIGENHESVGYVRWRTQAIPPSEESLPATGVSYDDIHNVFLPALRNLLYQERGEFRLPTEAEWEWAVRAGTAGHFYTGDSELDLDACAWYESNSQAEVQPVGGKEPNAWGLYDMLGNVWELTHDAYDSLFYLRSPKENPVNASDIVDEKVARGGSFINTPRMCRMANRANYMHRANHYPQAGFRIVLIPERRGQ